MICESKKIYSIFLTVIIGLFCFHAVQAEILDSGFGQNGQVVTSLGTISDRAYSAAIQPDGRIVVAGSSSSTSNLDFALVRYNSDGSLDTSFNYNGQVVTQIGGDDDEAKAVVILEDGGIVAGGYNWNGTDRDFALVRYLADGTLDRNFGLDGIVSTSIGNKDDEIVSLALQKDGRMLAAGYTTGTAGRIVVLARYLQNGVPDPDFGEDGIVFTQVSDDAEATRLAVQPDGKIIVTGIYNDNKQQNIMLLRYQPDGSLDETFGTDGVAITVDQEIPTTGYGLAIEDDGSILIAGTVEVEGNKDVALFRFTADGMIDTDFGYHGIVVANIGPEDDVGYDVRALDGSLVVAGFTTENGVRRFLRLEYVLAADSTKVSEITASTVEFGPNNEENRSLAVQEDGKVIGVGYTEDEAGSKFAVVRYQSNEDGTRTAAVATSKSGFENSSIVTTPVSEISRNSAFSGGLIMETGISYGSRGVVVSIAPYPVLKSGAVCNGSGGGDTTTTNTTTSTEEDGTDTGTDTETDTGTSGSLTVDVDAGLEECHTEDGSGAGRYSSILSGLKIGTRYYVRAYAESAGDVYYGNQLSFTTADACFIATAAYGSILDPHVSVLRNFRDRYLLTSIIGRYLVQSYYRHSPPIAELIANHTIFKQVVRLALLPMIGLTSLLLLIGFPGFVCFATLLTLTGYMGLRMYRGKCCGAI